MAEYLESKTAVDYVGHPFWTDTWTQRCRGMYKRWNGQFSEIECQDVLDYVYYATIVWTRRRGRPQNYTEAAHLSKWPTVISQVVAKGTTLCQFHLPVSTLDKLQCSKWSIYFYPASLQSPDCYAKTEPVLGRPRPTDLDDLCSGSTRKVEVTVNRSNCSEQTETQKEMLTEQGFQLFERRTGISQKLR